MKRKRKYLCDADGRIMKEFLSRREVAEILGVHVQTVANYISRGILTENPITRIGNGNYISARSVETLINEGYDIFEQRKNIELYKKELDQEVERLEKRERYIQRKYGLAMELAEYASKLKAVLLPLIASNEDISQRSRDIISSVLSGQSFEIIGERYNISSNRASTFFLQAIDELSKNDFQTVKKLRNKNRQLTGKILRLKEALRMYDSSLVPCSLVGKESITKMFTESTARILFDYGFENAYELALVPTKMLETLFTFGNTKITKIRKLLLSKGIELGVMNSINDPASMKNEAKIEITLKHLLERQETLQTIIIERSQGRYKIKSNLKTDDIKNQVKQKIKKINIKEAGVCYIPSILLGKENICKMFPKSIAEIFIDNGFENPYELTFVTEGALSTMGFDTAQIKEIKRKVSLKGIKLGQIDFLGSKALQYMINKKMYTLEELLNRKQCILNTIESRKTSTIWDKLKSLKIMPAKKA